MKDGKMVIALLTGGGDAPGLNAVIYSVVRACWKKFPGCKCIGYRFGYRGLLQNDVEELTPKMISGILHQGGTILSSSNKDNLFKYPVRDENGELKKNEKGELITEDVSGNAIKNMQDEGVDWLVVLGGDGTLTSARDFYKSGINVIGVPKTIDNDLASTDTTFGFDTAVNIVAENLGRLHTTAASHHRVMVVEVMGRKAGWIALHSGIAGSADVIIIPEIPYSIDKIIEKINERDHQEKYFTVIVVTEGAVDEHGRDFIGKVVEDSADSIRYGGVAAYIAAELEKKVKNHEVRHVTLGHIQRGGETSPADRLLSVRYGVAVADLIEQNASGRMVCLRGGKITSVELDKVVGSEAVSKTGDKVVDPLNEELVRVAKALGISFAEAEKKAAEAPK
jgi:6-phosphofructokinase 1